MDIDSDKLKDFAVRLYQHYRSLTNIDAQFHQEYPRSSYYFLRLRRTVDLDHQSSLAEVAITLAESVLVVCFSSSVFFSLRPFFHSIR